MRGTVRWFDSAKGFGYLEPEDGSDDVFVEFTVIDMPGFKTLHEDQSVTFDVVDNPRTRRAVHVVPAGDHAAPLRSARIAAEQAASIAG